MVTKLEQHGFSLPITPVIGTKWEEYYLELMQLELLIKELQFRLAEMQHSQWLELNISNRRRGGKREKEDEKEKEIAKKHCRVMFCEDVSSVGCRTSTFSCLPFRRGNQGTIEQEEQ